jgi:hypothetical protein
MKYLVLTPRLGLWYRKGSHFELIGYSDADYVRSKDDRKVPLGLVNFLVYPLYLGL